MENTKRWIFAFGRNMVWGRPVRKRKSTANSSSRSDTNHNQIREWIPREEKFQRHIVGSASVTMRRVWRGELRLPQKVLCLRHTLYAQRQWIGCFGDAFFSSSFISITFLDSNMARDITSCSNRWVLEPAWAFDHSRTATLIPLVANGSGSMCQQTS